MRKLLLLLFCFICINVFSQKDYSGEYGLDDKFQGRDLTLLKIDSSHYKFWANADSYRYANYSDGIFEMRGDSGVYKDSEADACEVIFKLNKKSITIYYNYHLDCRSYIDDHIFNIYPLEKYEKINQDDFMHHEYIGESTFKITSPKAILYTDSTGLKSKNQYFEKGDEVIGMDESSNYIYIEYLTPSGKFVNGWLRKEDTEEIKK